MANYVILNLFDLPYYEYSVALEGESYILQFIYNETAENYVINLFDAERTPLILGEALVPSYPLFYDYSRTDLTGYFYLEQKATLQSEPYKEYPDKLSQYYNFFYIYSDED